MLRTLATLVGAAAVYGFAVGSVHSGTYALRNLAKFPLLILATGGLCAVSYYLFSQFFTRRLAWSDVQRLAFRTFRDTALLLASLGPVFLFLAHTIDQPDETSLNEYPLFLALNVAAIALCGCLALVHQALALVRRYGLGIRRSVLITVTWLALSLFVGGQCAWYLRPFCGISTIPADDVPFCMGTSPHVSGARSFYEAVYHILKPPPLRRGYWRMYRGKS